MIRIAYDVKRYRQLLSHTVKEGDTVLEIGPHKGESTRAYMEKAGRIILVDKGSDCAGDLGELAGQNPKATYIGGDARGFDAIKLTLQHIQSCHVFAVDMGGGRHADTVFKVWATWSGVFKPRESIIRNRELAEFMQKTQVADDTLNTDFPDDGWLSKWGRKTPYKLKKQLEEFKYWIDINEPLM